MNGIDKITQRIGADTQAEIDRIRAENDAARAASSAVAAPPRSAAGPACTSCGAVNAPGTRFCGSCGAKLR